MIRRTLSAVAAAGLLACAAGSVAAQQDPAALSAAIDSIAMEGIEAGRVAGMSIAVYRGPERLHAGAYGYADLELEAPTPEDAVYEIGSVTKQFTAVAALMLVDEGKIDLEAPLSDWFPDFPRAADIPVHRLFDHTSGMKGYTEMQSFREVAVQDLPQDSLIALIAAEQFDFDPGEALIYNNSAYFVLGKIIEEASGQSYEEFVEERIFAAAGMNDSRYCHKDEMIPRRTKGYQPGPDGLRPANYLNHLWPYAAGSLCSTTDDLAIWNLAIHGDGAGGTLLSPEAYRSLITPGRLEDGTPVRYAKGLLVSDRDGKTRIGHGGGIFGYVSDLVYYPEEDLTITVLINTAGQVSPAGIRQEIENLVLGPVAPVVPRAFSGDLSRYTGSYRGPGRGQRLNVVVSEGEDGLELKVGGAQPRSMRWLGANTFAIGSGRVTFLLDGDEARVLQMDQGSGLYVLEKI
jgi:CubicO group peptidase (beta-lactamase class C family)